MFVEQPGCWLYPSYLLRAKLLQRLIDCRSFPGLLNGLYYLETDTFSSNGAKRSLCYLNVSEDLPVLNLLGRKTLKAWEHEVFSSLQFEPLGRARVLQGLARVRALLESAQSSPEAFVATVHALRSREIGKEWPRLVFGNCGRDQLRRIAVTLRARRLAPAAACLWALEHRLARCGNWIDGWAHANADLLLTQAQPAGSIWRSILLSVVAPKQIARRAADVGWPLEEGLFAFGHVADASGKRATLLVDPGSGNCYLRGGGRNTSIQWEMFRQRLGNQPWCRPAALVAYMGLAVRNCYMFLDRWDPVAAFQLVADRIHTRACGRGFPWIRPRFPNDHEFEPWMALFRSDYFVDCFAEDIDDMLEDLTERFWRAAR